MASQSHEEMDEANLAPSETREPTIWVQSVPPSGPDVYPRERHGDQAGSQDRSPDDSPQPQVVRQGATNVAGDNLFPGLRFPRKLWKLAGDDAFTSVRWTEDGDAVIIDRDHFGREVLCRSEEERRFSSNSLKNFIHQLNRYGFRKIRPSDASVISPGSRKSIMIYKHSDFQRDKPWLIENIKRRGNQVPPEEPENSATPAKRSKQAAPTRHSGGIYPGDGAELFNRKKLKKTSTAQGSSVTTQTFKFSALGSTGNSNEVDYPSERGGPSGEGTSRNVPSVPTATAETDGTGGLPTSSPDYPRYPSIIGLSYMSVNVHMTTLSVVSTPEEAVEYREMLDYRWAFCSMWSINPRP